MKSGDLAHIHQTSFTERQCKQAIGVEDHDEFFGIQGRSVQNLPISQHTQPSEEIASSELLQNQHSISTSASRQAKLLQNFHQLQLQSLKLDKWIGRWMNRTTKLYTKFEHSKRERYIGFLALIKQQIKRISQSWASLPEPTPRINCSSRIAPACYLLLLVWTNQ